MRDPRGIQASASRSSRKGAFFFDVRAAGFARATRQQAWRVLTDYERLDEFVPDLVSSKVLSRNRHEALVEQKSRTGFWLLSLTVCIVVRIEERPQSSLVVERISGDMRHYAGQWTLEADAQAGEEGTRITFCGEIAPDFPLPPLIGDAMVQLNMQRMVEAVVAEIERRSMH